MVSIQLKQVIVLAHDHEQRAPENVVFCDLPIIVLSSVDHSALFA